MTFAKRYQVRLHFGISLFVFLMIIALTSSILAIIHVQSENTAKQWAGSVFEETTRAVASSLDRMLGSAAGITSANANSPLLSGPLFDPDRLQAVQNAFIQALEYDENLYSIYVGNESGDFFQIIAPRGDPGILKVHKAPAPTAFITRTIRRDTEGPGRQTWVFLNDQRLPLGTADAETTEYDPRKRPWYNLAKHSPRVLFTAPYTFHSSGALGITAAQALKNGRGVLGTDLTLNNLSRHVLQQEVSSNGAFFLFDDQNRLMVASTPPKGMGRSWGAALEDITDIDHPYPKMLATLKDSGRINLLTIDDVSGDDTLSYLIEKKLHGGHAIHAAAIARLDDFTTHVHTMQDQIVFLTAILLGLFIPLVNWSARRMSGALERLVEQTQKIVRFDFTGRFHADSSIWEIHRLADAFRIMQTTLRERDVSLEKTRERIEKLVELNLALTRETNNQALLEKILIAAKELSMADAGTLYLKTDKEALRFSLWFGGTDRMPLSDLPLKDPETGAPNESFVSTHVAMNGKTVVVDDVYDSNEFDWTGTKRVDAETGYETRSMLTVPLKPRKGEVTGVLQLLNARDPGTGAFIPFAPEVVEVVEALASQAAVALDLHNLFKSQEELLDGVIKLIAGFVDAKSPYTGGHCHRVPVIAKMLAEAVHHSQAREFAEFHMNEREWKEFQTAAWLHDCGKVTTPENVVDKATKLETIHNRIHEIRMRFEVLRRDAEIAYLNGRLAGDTDRETLEKTRDETFARLQEEYAFIARSNVGGEHIADKDIERLRQIAQQVWIRHFDDRLGLSHMELKHLENHPHEPPPVEETLLADKPEHLYPRSESLRKRPFGDNPHGFSMTIPDNYFNRGELHNLSISRGTLTDEERFIINDHIIQTIIMLERLPFPERLARVPEYVGGHHETMVGTGYPRGLKREQMSIAARILAIADIFEALTASDRPYKKAKTLSQAIRIMYFMKQDQHIDPELFDIFLSEEIYRQYAEQFLNPEQIDLVDTSQYLSDNS